MDDVKKSEVRRQESEELSELSTEELIQELKDFTARMNLVLPELHKRKQFLFFRQMKYAPRVEYAPTIGIFWEHMEHKEVIKG